jgi:hypothetical protein
MTVWRWMVLISLFVAAVTCFAFGLDWYPDRTHRERKVVFAGCPSWQVPLSIARHIIDVECSVGAGYSCDLPLEVTFTSGDITPFMTLSETKLTCGGPPQTKKGLTDAN